MLDFYSLKKLKTQENPTMYNKASTNVKAQIKTVSCWMIVLEFIQESVNLKTVDYYLYSISS